MRAKLITLGIAAIATVASLGTAVATTRPAPAVDPAAILIGVGNPHGTATHSDDQSAANRSAELKNWENMYSRDVWPGMGVSSVHGN